MPNPVLAILHPGKPIRQGCLRVVSLLLVLALFSPTLHSMAASSSVITKLTADNAMATFIRDTADYPDSFIYDIGQDPETVTDLLYHNNAYNLMLAFSAKAFSYTRTGNRTGDYLLEITPEYFDSASERTAVRAYVDQVASEIFRSDMLEKDKLLAVNDFLIHNFEYDQSLSIYSVYPFITQKTGVCQAYAQLAVMLLLAGGMEAYPITGTSNGVGHAWVGVRVDGVWYEFDPTYNDSIGYQNESTRVEYLMRTHEDMVREGRRYNVYAPYTYVWVKETVRAVITETTVQVTQPAAQATVSPVPFMDIPAGQWYAEAVQRISAIGLMVGSNGLFSPNGTVSLAQAAAVAARVHAKEGQNEDILAEFIKEYKEQRQPWFRAYIDYCKMHGIIQGSEFGSSWETRAATREEMAYILHHAVGSMISIRQITIPDLTVVKPSYQPDVIAMANAGIISGTDAKNTFNPKGSATRAQLAVILARLVPDGEWRNPLP